MKFFAAILIMSVSIISHAECPQVQGIYVYLGTQGEALRIQQNGCSDLVLIRNNHLERALMDGRVHKGKKFEWTQNGFLETDYYSLFHNVMDQQSFNFDENRQLHLVYHAGKNGPSIQIDYRRVSP